MSLIITASMQIMYLVNQATLDKATAMLVNTQDVVNYGSDMEVDRDSITSEDMHTAPPESNQPTES